MNRSFGCPLQSHHSAEVGRNVERPTHPAIPAVSLPCHNDGGCHTASNHPARRACNRLGWCIIKRADTDLTVQNHEPDQQRMMYYYVNPGTWQTLEESADRASSADPYCPLSCRLREAVTGAAVETNLAGDGAGHPRPCASIPARRPATAADRFAPRAEPNQPRPYPPTRLPDQSTGPRREDAGKSCEDATCEDIRNCVRQFEPSKPYNLPFDTPCFGNWYACGEAAMDAIHSCCLEFDTPEPW